MCLNDKLYKAVNGIKDYQGLLVGLVDGNIVIQADDGEELSFPKSDVATTRLTVVF